MLNEEEQMVRDSARSVLESECTTALARAMEKDALGYPPALWKQIADLGWVGMCLPEAYGGQGMALTYLGLIIEEMGRAMAPLPLLSTAVPAMTIAEFAPDALKQSVLPAVSSGDLILTFAYQERDARLNPDAIKTTAVLDGDNYVVNGTKMFVDNSNVAGKVLAVVRTEPGSTGRNGLGLLLIDMNASGVKQTLEVTTAKDKQGRVDFTNVRVPKANLVAAGWAPIEKMLDVATALLVVQMEGCARKDAEITIAYAKERVAFGRPIGAFQSVAHMLADAIMWCDGAQLLGYEALWALANRGNAGLEVSQAKSFANDRLVPAVRIGQQIHGGIGFMMEFDIALYYRRVAAWSMRLGTSFEHRARIAAALIDQPGKVRLGEPIATL
ncbi:MAG: acyl-CoA dehydrogenase family protein [Dehalococcoidia bacterium]